jgi:hypothetical protein
METLKRVHLADVSMTPEQAISIAEILPEVKGLAHINLLENTELVKLADAKTEDLQEEACALYASLLAATRVSKTIVCVDVDVPSEESGEVVKAIAKQVVAYCLRNMERVPVAEISSAISAVLAGSQDAKEPPYPDVLAHLVGHDALQDDTDGDTESAPDEDYVIGGTGVVKALTCCLKNRGDDSRRQSGEFIRDVEEGHHTAAVETTRLPPGKAKDMSKHLLMSARKIRIRLQPALAKAKANPGDDKHNLRKLMFLDTTLAGIIKRFEDEFPDTRVHVGAHRVPKPIGSPLEQTSTSASAPETEPYPDAVPSDGEEDTEVHPAPLSRSNSVLSTTARALAAQEGRVLRAGHRFRANIITQEHFDLLSSLDAIEADPNHAPMLQELVEELGDEELLQKMRDKGVMRTYKEDKDEIFEKLRQKDPDHWERFRESLEKAKANVTVATDDKSMGIETAVASSQEEETIAD